VFAWLGRPERLPVQAQKAVNHDYALVFPVAAAIILVMLALMLRSLVAPWYLMASVGLGLGAALGASVLFFQNARGQAGLVFLLPVYIYVFVVALGTDYNILMTARLREEAAEGRPPREAAALALRPAGPTAGPAGLILAGRAAWWPGDSTPRSVATPAAASPEQQQPPGVTTAKHRRG
jgi:putative drug exporter of the RND superfamily